MISNESEYWAEGCQSWFDATVRCGADPQLSHLQIFQQRNTWQ